MNPRKFALYGGAIMLLIGVVSLIPAVAGSTLGLPVLRLETSYGLFLGLFPMNIINKIVLILFGVLGLAAANSKFRSLPLSILFSRAVLVVMGAAAVLGLFPDVNTMRGYWPLFGGEVWLHAAFAILGGYFGYALTSQVPKQAPRGSPSDFRSHVANT
jgi:hypothetical protein